MAYNIIPITFGNEERFVSFSKNNILLNDCFGKGYKSRWSCFIGTNYFLRKNCKNKINNVHL